MNLAPSLRPVAAAPVLSRFRQLTTVGPEMEALLRSLGDVQTVKAGAELIGERDPVGRPRFVLSGWAARVRWLPDGRRQILSFVVAGEAIGVCLRSSPLALSTTIALTNVQLLDAGPVQRALASEDPVWNELREAVHVSASLDEAYLLNQVTRLGRQTAYERMCHMLLEVRERLLVAGIGDGTKFPMPLTQEILADATGLSIVHVNRILQQLRRERLLDMHSGQVRLLDLAAIQTIADYRRPSSSPSVAPR